MAAIQSCTTAIHWQYNGWTDSGIWWCGDNDTKNCDTHTRKCAFCAFFISSACSFGRRTKKKLRRQSTFFIYANAMQMNSKGRIQHHRGLHWLTSYECTASFISVPNGYTALSRRIQRLLSTPSNWVTNSRKRKSYKSSEWIFLGGSSNHSFWMAL